MSPEFYTIIGVAIALTTLILNGQRSLARVEVLLGGPLVEISAASGQGA